MAESSTTSLAGTKLLFRRGGLVSWVETGAKPAGDDWLTPATVADPEFGCAFTDGAHLLGTVCP